jgi:hypothetical protein
MNVDVAAARRTRDGQARQARPILVALWVAWLALLAAAMVLGNRQAGHAGSAATWARMGSSLALVAAAWIGFWCWRGSRAGRFIALVALGMTLGTLGDFFNAGLLESLIPLPSPVLGGMISFGLGHIAYIVACVAAGAAAELRNTLVRAIWLAVWLAVAAAGWYAIVYAGAHGEARDLVWPALPYSLLLASTAGMAAGLAAQNRAFAFMALGAGLFFASDMLLAWALFRGDIPRQTELVWLTYGPGQMFIVFGAIAVCPMLAKSQAASAVGMHA